MGKSVIKHLPVIWLALWTGFACAQKPDLEGVRIVTHAVAGNVYMLEATGDVAGNIAVTVGADGVLIVDDQWAELTDRIAAAIADLDKGKLRFILNTHFHDDHADGNAGLNADHTTIVAHTNTRKRLLSKDEKHWPVITFDQQTSVHFNGEEIRGIHFPHAHTDSDVVYFFTGSNVVHVGDLWNTGNSTFPLADIESGGNALGILRAVEKLIPLIPDDAKIIPGHYGVSDKREFLAYRQMLRTTIDFVLERKAKGMRLAEIQQLTFPGDYADWGYGYLGPREWMAAIYNSDE